MAQKISKKSMFFHGKDSRFSPRIIRKTVFLIGQVPLEIWDDNSVLAIPYKIKEFSFEDANFLLS